MSGKDSTYKRQNGAKSSTPSNGGKKHQYASGSASAESDVGADG